MNRVLVPALWQEMGQSMPLSSVARAGTIVGEQHSIYVAPGHLHSTCNLLSLYGLFQRALHCIRHAYPVHATPFAQPTTLHYQPKACLTHHTTLICLYCADTGADFMNWNVANQVDRDRSTTITISSQRSTNSEGGRAGLSSHGTHVFGTVRRQAAPRCIVCSACCSPTLLGMVSAALSVRTALYTCSQRCAG
jgi:hypothetical protein